MEEEIEKSIVKKKIPVKLTGRNFVLYVFLIFNFLVGLFVLQVQLKDKTPTLPTHLTKRDSKIGRYEVQSTFIKFDLIATNLAEYDGPRRYIRIRPFIEVIKGQAYEEILLKKNLIRDKIIAYLNSLTPDKVLREVGLANLKSEVKKIFKNTLTHTKINMIFFSEFRVN